MVYRLEITSRADKCLADIVNYLCYHVGGFGNSLVARQFLKEYERLLDELSLHPKSHPLCEEPELNKIMQRHVHFRKYNYKIFYHIDGNTVFIDLIVHDLQDYQRML